MFNLEKSIALWKEDFQKSDAFTTEDITELESHLLDTIDNLTAKNLTQEEAFIKATENIGSSSALSKDYTIANAKGRLINKVLIAFFGFIFISLGLKIVEFIAMIILLPFANSLSSTPPISSPIYTVIANLIFSMGIRTSLLFDCTVILSIALGGLLIYLTISKFNVIYNYLISKINTRKHNKLYLFIFLFVIPTALFLGIELAQSVAYYKYIFYRDIYIAANSSTYYLYIIIVIGSIFAFLINYKPKNNNLVALSGYVIISIIPSFLFNLSNLTIFITKVPVSMLQLLSLGLYLILLAISLYILLLIQYKKLCTVDSKLKISKLFPIFIVISCLLNRLVLQYSTQKMPIETYWQLSNSNIEMNLLLLLLLQLTATIIIIKKYTFNPNLTA